MIAIYYLVVPPVRSWDVGLPGCLCPESQQAEVKVLTTGAALTEAHGPLPSLRLSAELFLTVVGLRSPFSCY